MYVLLVYLGNNCSSMGNCNNRNLNKAEHFVIPDVGYHKLILASSITFISNKSFVKEDLHIYCPILGAVRSKYIAKACHGYTMAGQNHILKKLNQTE